MMMEDSEPNSIQSAAKSASALSASSYHTPLGKKNGVTSNGIHSLSFASIDHKDHFNPDDEETGKDEDDVEEIDLHNDMNRQLRLSKGGDSSSVRQINDDNCSKGQILEYGFGRLNSAKRCLKRFSLKRPRVFGGCIVIIAVVLPLLITVAVQAYHLNIKLSKHNRKIVNILPATATQTWDEFSAFSTIAAVATDNAVCSSIAKNIMMSGGNAVDAAIAATLCLGVVSPASSGIGGGCYILMHNGTSLVNEFIDSREVAPKASTSAMFQNDTIAAQDGGLAVAVFSELRGLHLSWQRHGKLPWSSLVTPSAVLAESWVVDNEVALLLMQIRTQLHSPSYPLLSALYLRPDGSLKVAGDTVQQPVLAQTLRNVAKEGPDYLYSTMAATIAKEVQAAGGILTEEDIKSYAPLIHDPLNVTFMGHTYIGVGGSSSGGASVAGVLNFLGGYSAPLVSQGALYSHRLAEAYNHVFAIRMALGDPAFVNTTGPIAALLSSKYMGALRAHTSDTAVLPLLKYGGMYNAKYALKTDHGTTHLSVIDKWGNAVAITSTVNTYFGSKVVSPSTGILFNNQMDDFSIPGSPNFFGLAPSPLNYPQPFKRPLSSMCPSIVLDKKGRVRLIGGGSGGPKIITATVQVILNSIGLGMDLLTAVRSPRMHSQLFPPLLRVENHTLFNGHHLEMAPSMYAYLRHIGHNVTSEAGVLGCTQFIGVDPLTGVIEAVSDPRKDGRPMGL